MIYKNSHPQKSQITKVFVKKHFVFISFNGAPQLYLMSNCFFVFDLAVCTLNIIVAQVDQLCLCRWSRLV